MTKHYLRQASFVLARNLSHIGKKAVDLFSLRSIACFALSFLIVALVLAIPYFAGWPSPIDVAELNPKNSDAIELLNDVSSDLNAMGVGLIAAQIYMVRDWPGERQISVWIALVLGSIFAITSVYAGMNFRYAMAEQLMFSDLDFKQVGGRLGTQGAALVLSFASVVYVTSYRLTIVSVRTKRKGG